MVKELGKLTPYVRNKGSSSQGEAQRIGPGNCLTKTQGCAKSKDAVYSLTPARCRKVKRRAQTLVEGLN